MLFRSSYARNSEFSSFSANSMMKFASIKQLEIIGEAANHVTDETRRRLADIDWRKVVGLRNILVHEYFGVDENVVWDIIRSDLPELKTKVTKALQDF